MNTNAISDGRARGGGRSIVATYDYTDEQHELLLQVCRTWDDSLKKKGFFQRRPDPTDPSQWINNLDGVRRVLYRLPELMDRPEGSTVYICEGEKDVDTLYRYGLIATCNPMGAGSWEPVATLAREILLNTKVCVIADADEAGRPHAKAIAASLEGVADVWIREMPAPCKDTSDFFANGGSIEQFLSITAQHLGKNVADVFAELKKLGPRTRVKTCIPTFDNACRGGLPMPRLVVIGGAPGAGKTSLLAQWTRSFAEQGKRVFVLAVDESEEGLAFRLAQHVGCDMDLLEAHDATELDRAESLIRSLGIMVSEEGTIEENIRIWNPKRDDVVILDSLQTVRCEASLKVSELKGIVEANIRAAKLIKNQRKCLVVCTSEVHRGMYRNKGAAMDANPLAAFKETGAIEFAADTALVMTDMEAPPELIGPNAQLVDVQVPKNRRYKKAPFRLRLDLVSAIFTEAAIDDASLPVASKKSSQRTEAQAKQFAADSKRFLREMRRWVTKNQTGANARAIRAIGKTCGFGTDKAESIRDYLDTEKLIRNGLKEEGGHDWWPTRMTDDEN